MLWYHVSIINPRVHNTWLFIMWSCFGPLTMFCDDVHVQYYYIYTFTHKHVKRMGTQIRECRFCMTVVSYHCISLLFVNMLTENVIIQCYIVIDVRVIRIKGNVIHFVIDIFFSSGDEWKIHYGHVFVVIKYFTNS